MPTTEICGSSWPRTTSILSRAASSAKFAEMTLKLLLAARLSASSRVAGSAGRSRGSISRPGRMADGTDIFGPAVSRALPCWVTNVPWACASEDFGLRHIGAGHFADPKTVLRRLELLAQHLDVVAVDLDQRLVAHHVEIGLRNRLEHRGLDRQGLRPRRLARY